MSARRGGNRIRGPQSALTDFLASHNISAAQIRDEYERRLREADQDANAGEGSSNAVQQGDGADEDADEAAAAAVAAQAAADEAAADEAAVKSRKRKRNEEAVEKVKKAKTGKKKAPAKKKRRDSDDDDDGDDDYDDSLMYTKARPLPGQLEHCEMCNKRFTVTPYSKAGPDGGLVCLPCGKALDKDAKADKKALQPKKAAGRQRRKKESDRLDGLAMGGAKTLQQLCIEKVVQYHDDVDELGDMPQPVVARLSEIFAKKRVLNPKTLKLFTRPDLDAIAVHDAAYLEVEDYKQMFAVTPHIKRLVIRNACQFKDEVMDYMIEKCDKLTSIQLYAANLVSDAMWKRLFERYGAQLEALKLSWLDAAFDDDAVHELVKNCPNLQRLKLKLCRRLSNASITAISTMQSLTHLSLQTSLEITPEALVTLVHSIGPNLRTLSLEKFLDADDAVLAAIRTSCTRLSKFRLQENDVATDSGFAHLFTGWSNPPLTFADFSSTRDIDNNNPTGPEDAIGLAAQGFRALMAHSGSTLVDLSIASCRHIPLQAFHDVFLADATYPNLENINISFCNTVDTSVVAGIFKSCPRLRKVIAFGCFDVMDVVVPRGIALIGVPKAQDAIEQIGVGFDVMEALGRMVEVGA
ncbi:hypothetical protein MBLNU459_g6388t1 [Dothideomycetes sp. NU459]